MNEVQPYGGEYIIQSSSHKEVMAVNIHIIYNTWRKTHKTWMDLSKTYRFLSLVYHLIQPDKHVQSKTFNKE